MRTDSTRLSNDFIKDASIKTTMVKAENGQYIYKLTIKNISKENEDIINVNIKLKDDRKFEISFDV